MNKPIKPKKKIIVNDSARLDFGFTNNKMAISAFLDWVNTTPPKGAFDITIELCEDWCYDDCISSLELSWAKEIINTDYDKELKKYEKKLIKWEKKCQK